VPPTKRVVKRPAAPTTDSTNGMVDDPEDDEHDEPAPPKLAAAPPQRRLKKGWTAGQETMQSTSSYAQSFKPDENSQVIKFLEDIPYANFRRHWIEGSNDTGQRSVRAYTCLLSYGEACPLCEVGDKPQAVSAFNIAVVGDDGQVIRKSWDVGARLFGVLQSYSKDPKIAPLSKNYFMVSKTGKRNNVQYNISPVRPTSLKEDWGITPPDQAEFDRLELYDDTIITVESSRKLKELAQEITEEYDS
jgi:hypothetical protein